MDIKEYLELSEKTLSDGFHIDSSQKQKILHAAIGMATESAEILDAVKKHAFYGKEIDMVNIQEEIGDLMRYVAILLREYNLDFHQILDDNITKLKKRYGEKFSTEKAINRDTDHELSHIK